MESTTNSNEQNSLAKKEFLYDDNNSTACIILVEKACEQYQRLSEKYNVPFSYIDFFVSEFDKYSALFNEKLRTFFAQAKKLGLHAEDYVSRYTSSYYAQNSEIKADGEEKFLMFDAAISTQFTNKMREVTNTIMSAFIENILAVCRKIDSQDEIMNPLELYERYMIREVVLNSDKFKEIKETPKKATKKEVAENLAKTLVGNKIDDNYQQTGKITKVVIPKLNLPSAYPLNYEESRIISSKKTSKFCSASKQIIFINKNKIVGIKYSSAFIEKRKKKPKKNTDFNWDF